MTFVPGKTLIVREMQDVKNVTCNCDDCQDELKSACLGKSLLLCNIYEGDVCTFGCDISKCTENKYFPGDCMCSFCTYPAKDCTRKRCVEEIQKNAKKTSN